jgi:hypothetical protein
MRTKGQLDASKQTNKQANQARVWGCDDTTNGNVGTWPCAQGAASTESTRRSTTAAASHQLRLFGPHNPDSSYPLLRLFVPLTPIVRTPIPDSLFVPITPIISAPYSDYSYPLLPPTPVLRRTSALSRFTFDALSVFRSASTFAAAAYYSALQRVVRQRNALNCAATRYVVLQRAVMRCNAL